MVERLPDQTGAPPGHLRYFCSAGVDAFDVPVRVRPIGCPKGHGRREVGPA